MLGTAALAIAVTAGAMNIVKQDSKPAAVKAVEGIAVEKQTSENSVLAQASRAVRAKAQRLGAAAKPDVVYEGEYFCNFPDATSIDEYNIVDINQDGEEWIRELNKGVYALSMKYNSNLPMDDWAITPGIKVTAGTTYTFSIDAACSNSSFPEVLEVKVGNAQTVNAMSNTLIARTKIESADYTKLTAEYKAEADEVIYIGIHGMSDKDMNHLYVTNITFKPATTAPQDPDINMDVVLDYNFDVIDDYSSDWMVFDVNNDNITWVPSNMLVSDIVGMVGIQYNSSLNADDWFISPAFEVKAGKYYTVQLEARAMGFPERFEVFVGSERNPEGMTMEVVPATVVNSVDLTPYSGTFASDADKTMYVGIHGISDADQNRLFIDNVKVTAIGDAEGPAAPQLEASAPGDVTTVTLSIVAPEKDMAGNDITAISKIVVKRDDIDLVKEIANPEPGKLITIEDEGVTPGNHIYTAQAYIDDAPGATASASAFVGYTIPFGPRNLVITEPAEGRVRLTWDPSTEDFNMKPIEEGDAKYVVATFDLAQNKYVPIAENIEGTEYEYDAVTPGEQMFIAYGVYTVTSGGESAVCESSFLPIGTPYEMPFIEGFKDGTIAYDMMSETFQGNGAWGVYKASDVSGPTDADGNNGLAVYQSSNVDDSAALYLSKVKVEGEHPMFVFSRYGLGSDDDNTIDVYISTGDLYENMYTCVAKQEGQWKDYRVDLTPFSGQTVAISLVATTKTYQMIFVDNLRIIDIAANDLALSSITAPAAAKAGEKFNVAVAIENVGINTAEGATVTLFADGKEVATKEVAALEAEKSVVVDFECTLNAAHPESVTFTAEVNFAADEQKGNNSGLEAVVARKASVMPAVDTLSAEATDSDIALSWDAPTTPESKAETVTETFENAPDWAQQVEGWTMVDKDGKAVGGISGGDFPGIIKGQSRLAYFVMNTTVKFAPSTGIAAHSGDKVLANMYNADGSANSDWLISPELCGEAQAISFWARSMDGDLKESIRVLYSYTDKNTAAFKIANTYEVPGAWTEYKVNLPAGVKYFAIETFSTDKLLVMIDDITYTPAPIDYTVLGYNIYRDGVKINDEPVAATSYADCDCGEGNHEYAVSALYANGESELSNKVSAELSGINDIATEGISIKAEGREIKVAGMNGETLAVYSVDGRTIYFGNVEGEASVAVATGVYIVKAGNTTARISVR